MSSTGLVRVLMLRALEVNRGRPWTGAPWTVDDLRLAGRAARYCDRLLEQRRLDRELFYALRRYRRFSWRVRRLARERELALERERSRPKHGGAKRNKPKAKAARKARKAGRS